jgi:ribosomal protein S14
MAKDKKLIEKIKRCVVCGRRLDRTRYIMCYKEGFLCESCGVNLGYMGNIDFWIPTTSDCGRDLIVGGV